MPVLARHPDVAVVIGTAKDVRPIIAELKQHELAMEYIDQLTVSALSTLVRPAARPFAARARRAAKRASIAVLNWLFATPVISNKVSVAVITQPFKSYAFCQAADSFIRLTMAGASACLNSSVIPFITGKANVSFGDAGTIAWAGLKSRHRLLGLPAELYRRLETRLVS